MTHKEIRMFVADRIAELLHGGTPLPIELRPYQRETLAKTETWLRDEYGSPRGHVVYATGLGKTVVFAALIAACAGIRTLVVVPTKTLLEQTARAIVRCTGGIVGHISSMPVVLDEQGCTVAVRNWWDCDIVVTTDESLALRGQKIARNLNPQLVIYDECHWAFSHPARFALGLFPEAVVIGFTATPDYLTTVAKREYAPVTLENGAVLYGPPSRFARSHFGMLLDDRSVLWGIEEGYLSPLAWGRIDLDISLDRVRLVEGRAGLDYNEGDLTFTLRQKWPQACQAMIDLYNSGEYELKKRQTFTICSSVEEAEELARAIGSINVPSACVTGRTPDHERRRILSAFRANEIKFITSVMVLREGWDSPNAEVCVMLRPTRSRVLYVQSIGRVLRTIPTDEFKVALVIDAHFQGTTFAPFSAPVVFGEPGQRVRVGDVLLGGRRKALPADDADVMTVARGEPEIAQPRANLPTGDRRGILTHDGKEWWSIASFAMVYGITDTLVRTYATQTWVPRIRGLNWVNRPCVFYELEALKRACEKLIARKTPQLHRLAYR